MISFILQDRGGKRLSFVFSAHNFCEFRGILSALINWPSELKKKYGGLWRERTFHPFIISSFYDQIQKIEAMNQAMPQTSAVII
jgi:hypothetical protein